jgi:zinc carboxypeptidase
MKRAAGMLAAAVIGVCAVPSVAQADPVVDQAVAQLNDLGIGTLTGMPSGRTTYRTTDEFNAELDALAAAYPTQAVVKEAPFKSIQGRTIKYIEITNNATAVGDGKPVFFNMGAIHGNESAAAEDSLEFAYDVLLQAKTNPKVAALLDKVRLIDLPLTNPDGHAFKNATTGAAAPRRASCGPVGAIVPPATCSPSGVDLNRNYPFGWGSNIGVSLTQRGSGPGSEPEVKNTMDIVQRNQVVTLMTQHTNSRAIFYPGLEVFAGQTPDLNNGYRDLALAMAHATADGYTNVRDSAHDYETSGETVDWSYYATRGIANTLELVGGGAGCPQALPPYQVCTAADYTGTPGPGSTAAQTARFQGHPVRNAIWLNLVYASLAGAHSQITGSAVPGATLKIAKDFNLYTAPVQIGNTVGGGANPNPGPSTPPQAIPTHLESSLKVPASGAFKWDVNPSVRPVPAYEADGVHAGPRGFYAESWTLTCTAADGTLLGTTKVLVDKGDVASVSPCTSGGAGGTVPATLSLTLGANASFGAFTPGLVKDYTASTTANVISTAGDAALTVSDPGKLMNGTFALPSPLEVTFSKSTWTAPVSNDPVTINFKQHIGATDALRTGTYSKTLTFTLSTTTP